MSDNYIIDELTKKITLVLRESAWERAKGELISISSLRYSYLDDKYSKENFSKFDKLLNEFIKTVEDEALLEQ